MNWYEKYRKKRTITMVGIIAGIVLLFIAVIYIRSKIWITVPIDTDRDKIESVLFTDTQRGYYFNAIESEEIDKWLEFLEKLRFRKIIYSLNDDTGGGGSPYFKYCISVYYKDGTHRSMYFGALSKSWYMHFHNAEKSYRVRGFDEDEMWSLTK